MKKLILILLSVISGSLYAQNYASFGEKINPNKAVSVEKLMKISNPEKSIQDIKIKGEVTSVCQVKGCWMNLKINDEESIKVTFKDYGFFVPTDIIGKEVIIQGDAEVSEISVAELKHYAEDAGKSKEEIEKIKEPKTALAFVAKGVLVEE